MFDKLMSKARTARHLALMRVRHPLRREAISKLIGKLLPSPEEDERSAGMAAQIRENGYAVIDNPLSIEKLRLLRDALEPKLCFDAWRPERGQFERKNAPDDSNNIHIVDVELIPEAVELANDPTILAAVGAYLGCKPTIDDILAWWSLPGRSAPFEEQYFHRDWDSIRFVKLFVYLSDVSEADGPHVFVRGSHRSDKLLLRPGRRRSDEDVLSQVNPEDVIRFTGPFGTTFLEDTFGLHKGTMPTTGTRLVLQVRYTMLPSPFVSTGKQADVGAYDAYTNRFFAAS
jgi:hypothetical protein